MGGRLARIDSPWAAAVKAPESPQTAALFKAAEQRGLLRFEFRHRVGIRCIMRILANENIAQCISDHHDAPAPWKRTADFVYVRGHGPGGRYKGHYSTATLQAWAKRIKSWKAQGCDVFAFFDNDQKSAAPADALKLGQMLRAKARAKS